MTEGACCLLRFVGELSAGGDGSLRARLGLNLSGSVSSSSAPADPFLDGFVWGSAADSFFESLASGPVAVGLFFAREEALASIKHDSVNHVQCSDGREAAQHQRHRATLRRTGRLKQKQEDNKGYERAFVDIDDFIFSHFCVLSRARECGVGRFSLFLRGTALHAAE